MPIHKGWWAMVKGGYALLYDTDTKEAAREAYLTQYPFGEKKLTMIVPAVTCHCCNKWVPLWPKSFDFHVAFTPTTELRDFCENKTENPVNAEDVI